ncbi:SDR family NAD(P)-dependent oxidoreductase [Metabacillus sp. 84]|uniref:SDR family NAD(P)-dependent oxidoreductase n=1 Tax=Metabacillus sp. 84 TaxID=3404705 RepID=UPI003CFAA658
MIQKTILIVGAGPGISLAAAKKFGKEGFNVAMISRNAESLLKYENQLNNEGIKARGFAGDVSSAASLKSAINEAVNTFGAIDVLLYNAAKGTPGKPTTLTGDQLIQDFKVNVAGALASVQEILPHMEKGALLLTGGGLALYPYADYSSLAIGKAGTRSLAYSLHEELSPKGIYVGTLTIKGFVEEGTGFSAENIAQAIYSMYESRKDLEIMYEKEQ